jgi:3-phenylpropionate/trans-cinnamate dioxygenase ferredoxin reductase component
VVAIRRLPDSLRVRELAREGSAIVVGGGFIASEAAASLATHGAAVTLIDQEPLPQRGRVGDEVARRIAAWLHDLGVEHIGGAQVTAIDDGRVAVLADGRRVQGACTVLATGVRPRSELAAAAGLATESGYVLVDERMYAESAERRVMAVGDVALARNTTAGRRIHIEHWGDALGQGEVAGGVLAGRPVSWSDVPGFWTTIGEHTLKFAGWGDGYDDARFDEGRGGDFTARYTRGGVIVGVLTHGRDSDYDDGRRQIAAAAREAS